MININSRTKKNNSCEHAVLLTRHKIEEKLGQNKFVLAIMTDLSGAFDSIENGTILPSKLKHYGADKKSISFFKSFFNKRQHFVQWNGVKSSTKDLFNVSCIQGSCLGPGIFNTYVRDYEYVIKDKDGDCDCPGDHNCEGKTCDEITSDGVFFADDSVIIVACANIEKLMRKGNIILDNTSKYMNANHLILNQKKSQYLLFKPKKKQSTIAKTKLMINNQEILEVTNARYLGVILDNKLNFQEHFKMVKSKLIEGVRALRCTRATLNYHAKKLLYDGCFKSHAEYCSITYMDKLNKRQQNELYTLQKQAIRLVFNARKNVHTEKLFRLANILPITKLYESECTKLVFKYKSDPSANNQPIAIKELLIKKTHDSTRIYDDLYKIKIPSSYKYEHCMYQIINNYNNSNLEAKMCGNLWSLKRKIKEDCLQSLRKCEINNCNICLLDNWRNYEKYMSK